MSEIGELDTATLIDGLRYQIVRPEVTTMGLCPLGCGYSSRGSNFCSACLMRALTAKIGPVAADSVYHAHLVFAEAGAKLRSVVEQVLREATP